MQCVDSEDYYAAGMGEDEMMKEIDIMCEAKYPRCGVTVLRPSVREFAELMERKLQENESKGTWESCNFAYLQHRILEEHKELVEAAKLFLVGEPASFTHGSSLIMGKVPTPIALKLECADIANFAMMISDNITNMRIR